MRAQRWLVYRDCLKVEPKYADALCNLGNLLMARDNG